MPQHSSWLLVHIGLLYVDLEGTKLNQLVLPPFLYRCNFSMKGVTIKIGIEVEAVL